MHAQFKSEENDNKQEENKDDRLGQHLKKR